MLATGAMDVNAGVTPPVTQHPALSAYVVYAYLLELLRQVGVVPVSDMQAFGQLPDPLLALPAIYEAGRLGALCVSLACALLVGIVAGIAAARVWVGTFAGALALLSAGLLVHSLIVRTEAVAVLFALVSALILVVYARTGAWPLPWLAGVAFGLALLSKTQVLPMALVAVWWLHRALRSGTLGGETPPAALLRLRLALAALLSTVPVAPLAGFVVGPAVVSYWIGIVALALLGSVLLARRARRDWRVILLPALLLVAGVGCGLRLGVHLSYAHLAPKEANFVLELVLAPSAYLRHGKLVDVSPAWVVSGLARYLAHYGSVAFLHVAALCVALVVSRRLPAGVLPLYAVGLLFCLVSSMRGVRQPSGISEHYLVFADVPFVIASALVALEVAERPRWASRGPRLLALLTLSLATVGSGLAQWRFVAEEYPTYNATERDRIDLVPAGFYPNAGFHAIMHRRYGSDAAIMRRIVEDPRLNGSRDGIEIRRLPGVASRLPASGPATSGAKPSLPASPPR